MMIPNNLHRDQAVTTLSAIAKKLEKKKNGRKLNELQSC